MPADISDGGPRRQHDTKASANETRTWRMVIEHVRNGMPIGTAARAHKMSAHVAVFAARDFEYANDYGKAHKLPEFRFWLGSELSAAAALAMIDAIEAGDKTLDTQLLRSRDYFDLPKVRPPALRPPPPNQETDND